MSDLEQPRHLSRPIWILAALGAVALHVGGIAAALKSMQPDDDIDLGAPAIEIGVELAAPHLDANDLPVGPDTEATAASPAVVEQKAVIERSDLPKAAPTETDDPDRVVAPNETKKPDDDPKIPTVQTSASTESIATEQTAVPIVQSAPVSAQSVAPVAGIGTSARRDRVTWQKQLAAHLNKYKRYPSERIMQHAEVVVSFVLDRVGHVVSTRIVKGSGDPAFDAAAKAMLQRADPVPPPPPLVADEGLSFTLPVIFHVQGAETTATAGHRPK
jgi:periplasmic protein TonB